MSASINFTLNGKAVETSGDETIWQVAERESIEIPHLCYTPEPGYRADGNCRACVVEVEGERALAASCIRKPTEGMVVNTLSERAKKSQEMVMELLVADQPARATSHDPNSRFWQQADLVGVSASRYPASEKPKADNSHVAMAVNLDACINCNLCVRACREVQVNDVIGMSYRGSHSKVSFDFDVDMGTSTCVACGECVQACPTGALMPANVLDENGTLALVADRVVNSICPFCGVGCQTEVHIKDDKIIRVEGRNGPANMNRMCVKGRFGYDYVHHDHRLTKPLIRRDDAPKQWDIEIADNDWSSVFREATWEEALEAAAGGLKKTYDANGPQAMAGFGSAKGSNEEAYLLQKLIRAGFHTNNIDHCTRLCHASSVAALIECVSSGAVSAPFTDATKSDCIIAIGCNPAQNHPVAATYFKQAAKQGAALFIMDPRGQPMSSYATEHLHFNPGADVSMLNAIIHVIVEEELYDKEYIERKVDGFEELKKHIKDFSPEAMSPICGISPDVLRSVARTYATSKNSIIFWGMGVSQHIHGTDNARCLITLSLITGQIGRPGTGLHPLRGQNNVQGASDVALIPIFYPDYKSVENPVIIAQYEKFWNTHLDHKKGLTVVEIIDAIIDDQVKAMYIQGENPAMSDPDQKHARKALAKLEHLVVQDIFLTETAWHADVILPASAHAEKLGTYTNSNRQVQMGRACVPMPGEARQDLDILIEMGKRVGIDWDYSGPEDVFAEMKQVMMSLNNITWDRLEDEDCVTFPCDAPDKPGNDVIFTNGFPTQNGKGRIVPAHIIPPDDTQNDEFPMVLTTGRMLEHWHTGAMTRRSKVLDNLEPEAVVSMNWRDMKRMGLEPGEMTNVHTRRGTITLAVRQNPNQPEGVLFIPFCFAEAPANVLTNPKLDPFGKIPEFKFSAARIESAG